MKKLLLLYAIVCVSFLGKAQQVFMQGWYWDYPKTANGFSWADTLRLKAPSLATAGFTHIWFPPHAVASFGTNSNGYDPKDLFIGNQTTGLGTRAALNNMLSTMSAQGIAPVADLIYNHRDGGAAEINPVVKAYITNFYTAAKEPYPSDRFFCALPVGGTTGNGAGDYFFKLSSKTGDNRFNGKGYKLYMQTSLVGFGGLPAQNEAEPNGGGDCGQGNNTITLGRDMLGTIETTTGCNTDEFKLTLANGQFNPAGDTIFIYMNNTNGYADHRFYGIYSTARATDIVNELLYMTYTNYNNMASGRGQMNYEFFKPNSTNASTTFLNGDWDSFLFFYDYDQFQKRTQDTLIDWTKWNYDELGVRGIRMDAVKHFTPQFVGRMLDSMYKYNKIPSLVVGEWYDANPVVLKNWVNDVKTNMSAAAQAAIQPKVFDFTLREQLRQASDNAGFDVRNVFTGSLRDNQGMSGFNVVTFANNHDFRDASGFSSLIRNNNDLAYAYLLTNNQIGVPTIFYPDYYGYPAPSGGLYSYHPTNLPALKTKIDSLIYILKTYINGSPSIDYLNRFSTPYTSQYISGSANKSLIYQLRGSAANGNRDIIVAINYGTTRLQVNHQINTNGGAITQGVQFFDILGNSAFPFQQVDALNRVYIDLPPKSYSVWSQNSLILPVSLLSFNGVSANNKVNLQWNVNNEINVEKYEVERSLNGTSFSAIGQVTSINSNNYSYGFVDAALPKAAALYYRLKIIDKDNSFKYSEIIKVQFNVATFEVNIYPNPTATNNIAINIETTNTTALKITVVNNVGQQVISKAWKVTPGTTNFPVDVSTLAKGTYNVVVDDGKQRITKPLVKQ
ncbi:alpha-amylase domain-containing protein [Ferruginibacter yonginensis]|uniref:Alpha-amylase domain-containing protein n=1 Tax=Ferruginibacter yonginensis TaxID=1310416 RepID=A0ABV8QT69_9BACT